MIDRLLVNLRHGSLSVHDSRRACGPPPGQVKRGFPKPGVPGNGLAFRAPCVKGVSILRRPALTLHLDALRDLKNVNTHLVAAAAYPVLENKGRAAAGAVFTQDDDGNGSLMVIADAPVSG